MALCVISDGLVFNLRLGSDWFGGAEGRSQLVNGQECWHILVSTDVGIGRYEFIDGVMIR